MKKLFLATTALTALVAAPAHAGPVAAAVSWIGSTLAAGGIGAALLRTAIGIGASLLSQALAPTPGAQELSVKFEVQLGDDKPLSFIAGDHVTAGKRKYVGSWGKDTRFITDVIELSGLPQPGLIDMWVDDEQATFTGKIWGIDPNDDPSGFSDQGEYDPGALPAGWISAGRAVSTYSDDGNRIYVKYIDGTQIAADPFLTMVFGSDPDYPWTADMIGTGKSYAIVTTRYDDDTLTSYPAYLFQPDALPMYDIRKDDTAGGVGAHRWGQPETYAPSRNPVVIAYNIIRGISFGSEWVWGGKDLAAWRLPAAEWMAAANECDAPVSLSGGGTEPAYRCGMEIDVSMTPADVLEEIGKAANMHFAEVGGMIKPIVGLPGAAAMSITDDSIIITEGQSFKPFNPVSDTFNALSATYPEPGEKWTTKDSPEFIDTDATAADGGRYLPTSVSYPAAPYSKQVQRLQRAQMQDFRRFRRHQFNLPPEAYPLEPGVDMISWTSARNGYVDKLFVVESVAKTPGMNVLVSLREVDPSDYDWSSGFEMPTDIATPVNPVPFTQPITGLAVQAALINDGAGQPRRPAIRVSADGDESAGVSHIQIQACIASQSDTVIDTNRRFSTPFTWYLQDVIPATDYEVRARLISERTPKSQWSAWLSVTTLDQRYTLEDMAQDVTDEMEATAEAAGIKSVTELPATGDKPNQIVMLVPEGVLYRWDETAQDWTTEIYAGTPDGSIDTAKFAQGIEPVSVIDSSDPLPTTKSTESVFWQGKLYRWSGSEYTATVPAVDVTGQLTSEQIADIEAAKITGEITGPQIADSAVSAQKIANGAVDAIKLATQAVTGDKIAAAAVGADQIAANAIVASKIAVTDFTNLVSDPGIIDPDGSWLANGDWNVQAFASTTDWDVARGWQWPSTASGTGWGAWLYSDEFPVRASHEYYAEFQGRDTGGTGGLVGAYIVWIDKDGNHISANTIHLGNLTNVNGTRYGGSLTSPSAAITARFRLRSNLDTKSGGNIYVTSFNVKEKNTGQLIVDGAITASKIAADAVNANKIAAGAIQAAHINAGAVTTNKVAANAITANKIATNTITASEIASNAITANELAANSISANHLQADSVTAGKIAAAAIGADQIAAGAITTSKLLVSDFTNLVPDSDMSDLSSWTIPSAWSRGGSGGNFRGAYWVTNDYSATGSTSVVRSTLFPVEVAQVYYFAVQIRGADSSDDLRANFRVKWYNRAKTEIGEEYIQQGYQFTGTTIHDLSGSVTAPGGAVYAEVLFHLGPSSVSGKGVVGGWMCRRVNGGELIVDGAITANKVAAGAITTNAIAAGAIVTSRLAAGAVTTDKVAANTITSGQINVGELVGSSAFLNQLVVDTAQIANGAIQTAKIGNLQVDTIKIADAAVTKFLESANYDGVSTDNTSTPVVIVARNWSAGTAELISFRVRYKCKASSGGAVSVYVRVVRNGQIVHDEGYDVDATSSGDGAWHEVTFTPEWIDAGSSNIHIAFTTSGFHAKMAGDITLARWVK